MDTSIHRVLSSNQDSSEQNTVLIFAFGLIAVLSFVGNVILCIVILRKRFLLKQPYNVLIFNLAVTDLLTGIFIAVTPNYVLHQQTINVSTGVGGELFCRLISSTYFLFVFGKGSTLTVMCLAIERWFSIVKPLKYKYAFKKQRLLLYISIVWICSCCTQINELFHMQVDGHICVKTTPPYGKRVSQFLTLFHILITFFVPSIVTWVTFAHVWTKVRQRTPKQNRIRSNYELAKRRLLRMCAVTALIMTLCWFPAEFVFILHEFDALKVSHHFYQFCDVLAMSNASLNPWVYCLFNRQYRAAFFKIFRMPGIPINRLDIIQLTLDANELVPKGAPPVLLVNQRILPSCDKSCVISSVSGLKINCNITPMSDFTDHL